MVQKSTDNQSQTDSDVDSNTKRPMPAPVFRTQKTVFLKENASHGDDGYYGNNCKYKCITPNCKRCYQHISINYCSKCKSGYHWNNFTCYNCGSQCKSCDSNSCLSCYNGYWGVTCENNCTESCASCRKSNGDCFSCEQGYYLHNGKCNTCDTHCDVCIATWCLSCFNGYWGETCEYSCNESCASCRKWNGNCISCDPGYYVYNGKCNTCDTHCAECVATLCTSCRDGYWGISCQNICTANCASCNIWTGDCLSCEPGYRGGTCEERCVEYCLECDRLNGNCISCDKGHWGYACDACNVQCKTCNHSNGCLECNVGYYGQTCDKECGAYCQTCDRTNGCLQCLPGYYTHNNICAECSYRSNGCTCTSKEQCSGCVDGYFLDPPLCSKCPEYCSNCNKSSLFGSTVCTSCPADTFGKTCQYFCSQDCKNGYCDEENPDETCSQCANGRFGEKCEHICSLGCEPRNCTKETGSCTCKAGWNGQRCETCMDGYYGRHCNNSCPNLCQTCDKNGQCLDKCQPGYRGESCQEVIKTKTEKQTTSLSPAALGGGIGGGIVALSAIVLLVLLLIRRRKVNLSNKCKTPGKEPENLSALNATVNKGRASTAEYTFGDSDNLHSVTIIESPNIQSPPPNNRSGKETTHIFTEDNEDDASARELAVKFEENGGVYYNSAEKISTLKLPVTGLLKYAQNIRLKNLEEEFQKIPYGLVKAYGVSQTKLNMHSNRYKGIYPYDDSRVIVRGGKTDYINASYMDGFRRRNAYIATLGPMAKQLGNFGQFWRMVWQQEVEKIVMVTSLVEGKNIKCEQYWPDRYQSKLYGAIEVVCKVEKLYADFIWRQFTLSKNSEERSLHHLQFTNWPDKDIPDDVTSIIDIRQRVNALPSSLEGPILNGDSGEI
ncbi:PTPRS-like protein [Mya arenaria]|uniref:protein-tyrosine-phosphatase n=1 Tax=Mya arenaria TaxID=6604 RepID=A0ABY7G6X7_MYAAR|nr:PTPRS-like protein [Mya arenaria]